MVSVLYTNIYSIYKKKKSIYRWLLFLYTVCLLLKSITKKLDFQISCLKNLTKHLEWKQFIGDNSLVYVSEVPFTFLVANK